MSGIFAVSNYKSHTMKTFITSMLIASMTIGSAFATVPNEKGKSAPSIIPATPVAATMSMQQLQEENTRLKAQLVAMENKLEEEKSMLQFRLTMQNMLASMDAQKLANKVEEEKSLAQFNFTMQKLLNQIELQRKAEMLEDTNAKANYNKVMGNMLLILNSK